MLDACHQVSLEASGKSSLPHHSPLISISIQQPIGTVILMDGLTKLNTDLAGISHVEFGKLQVGNLADAL